MYARCFEFDLCLWWHDNIGFRQSAGKDVMGTIKVVPLEDDWTEWEFAAGKAPKFEPAEETYAIVEQAEGEPLITTVLKKHWTPESPGTTPPWHFGNPPGSPPWWCLMCGGGGGKPPIDTPNPSQVPLPDALGFMIGIVCLYVMGALFKHSHALETIR